MANWLEQRLVLIHEVIFIRSKTAHYCYGVKKCIPCAERRARFTAADERFREATPELEKESGVFLVATIKKELARRAAAANE